MPPSVLHVCEPIDGGAAVVVNQLVDDQVPRGWDVTVAGPTGGFLLERSAASGARAVAWDAVGGPGPGGLGGVQRLGRIIAELDPDVVHLHSSKAGLAGRLALRGRRPTIFQPHGWSFRVITGWQSWAALRWERRGARWATIVNVSEAECRRGVAAGLDAEFEVIANSVDTERFAFVDDTSRRAARADLGLVGAPTAICVGRMTAEKGHDVLLAAWPGVREQVPEAVLLLVGDGPLRAAFESLGLPGVRFVGEVTDVRPWLGSADVLALPSHSEGMALSVLEALSTGLSIVATDVDGAREAVGDRDSPAGQIVPIGDSDALGAAIVTRLTDLELARLEGRRGRARAEERFDRRRWGELFANLVERLREQASGLQPP